MVLLVSGAKEADILLEALKNYAFDQSNAEKRETAEKIICRCLNCQSLQGKAKAVKPRKA